MTFRYGVLGAGRQGLAAAYDLVMRGDAEEVELADVDGAAAAAAADRLNALLGASVRASQTDVTDTPKLVEWLRRFDAALSAVPYGLNLAVTDAAIAAGTHVCDLGGNAVVVRAQLGLDEQAKAAGVSVVPDCGQVPGAGANLMAYAVAALDEPEDVVLYDGGIPLNPRPPWHYELTFNMDGLTNEYDGTTVYIREGAPVAVPCFADEEYELLDFGTPFGSLEAFPTAGGTTTAAQTLGSRLRTLKNKTLRYPGHAAQFKAFRDAGFFGQEPIDVDGVSVVPRALFHAMIEPKIRATEATRDVVLTRVVATGKRHGKPVRMTLDVVVHYDEALQFTAMQQATGWHAAIVCRSLAAREVEPGVTPVELAIDPVGLLDAFRQRNFIVDERVEP
jgi:lysine 6-dehydrogenase